MYYIDFQKERTMSIKQLSIVLIASILVSTQVYAEVKFSGYGSVTAGKTLGYDEVFLADLIGGGAYNENVSFSPESLFALQVSSRR